MRTYIDCMPCFVRQSLEAVRYATPEISIHEQVVRAVLNLASEMDMNQSPPYMAQQIHRWIRNLSAVEDPYYRVKQQFNSAAVSLYPALREKIDNSENQLETAIRLAIAGNIIDFGIFGSLQESELAITIENCLTAEFDTAELPAFIHAVRNAEKILYLADNAGEIGFDRLLIERLPVEKVTVVVKSAPIINDATIDDAQAVGLTSIVEVIENGSDAPGTLLDDCSADFQSRFINADLVIAKGQGNYETLSDIDQSIYFLLKIKCSVIANHMGCDVGRMIFQHSAAYKGKKQNAKT